MSLFCAGWTFIWLLLLPFGVIPDSVSLLQGDDKVHTGSTWWAILPISVMTAMMLGLEDLATQLEDPFKFIPYGEGAGELLRCRMLPADAVDTGLGVVWKVKFLGRLCAPHLTA
jgi:hypothetical protein